MTDPHSNEPHSKIPDFAKGVISQGLIDRVKNILMKPAAEWLVIDAEPSTTRGIYVQYVAVLAAIGPIASFIGRSVFGISVPFFGTYRVPIVSGILFALVSYVLAFVGVFVTALIVDALAPTFGGQKDPLKALKVTAYSFTAAWLAGIFQIIPMLSILGLVGLYSFYLIYLGLPVLMKSPKDKALGYTAAVCVVAAIVWIVIGAIAGAVIGGVGYNAMSGASTMSSEDTGTQETAGILSSIFGGKSAADRERVNQSLQSLQKMGEQQQAAEDAARANGQDPNAVAAKNVDVGGALGAIGAIVTGGSHVKPVDIHSMKDMLPASLGGMKRTDASAESNQVMGISASSATAHYSNGSNSSMSVEITDMGSASGLAGLAMKFDPNMERETDTGYERTQRVNGMLVHQQYDNRDHSGSADVIAGGRFAVSVKGNGVSMDDMVAALKQVDIGKLASLAK
ncbi:MAG TPA: Yip1 family protein [Rhizomicrobium sp.]|nr:Yip1 family protein [Rhizomicrobium sp.]